MLSLLLKFVLAILLCVLQCGANIQIEKCKFKFFESCTCRCDNVTKECSDITCDKTGIFTNDNIKEALSSLNESAKMVHTLRIEKQHDLTELPSEIFGPNGPLEGLKYLHLPQNGIGYVHNDTFTGMDNIIQFEMDYNKWNLTETGVFQHFKNLKILSLKSAFAWESDVPKNDKNDADYKYHSLYNMLCQKSLRNLEKLYLDQNSLTAGVLDFIGCLPSLKTVSLTKNKMIALYSLPVPSTNSIEKIDLAHNILPYIKEPITSALENLSSLHPVYLDISHNEFACQLDYKDFVSWINQTSVNISHRQELTCYNCSGHDVKIVEVKASELKECHDIGPPHKEIHAGVVIIGIVVVCLIGLILLVVFKYRKKMWRSVSGNHRRSEYRHVPPSAV